MSEKILMIGVNNSVSHTKDLLRNLFDNFAYSI